MESPHQSYRCLNRPITQRTGGLPTRERINEQLADIVSKHPTRFGAMATLPALAATDGLLEEMAYALDTLKLDGVATSTSIDDIYLGDTRYDPWFEEMNRRASPCLSTQSQPRHLVPVDLGIDVSILEFMFDTTRMLTKYDLWRGKETASRRSRSFPPMAEERFHI